jgi:hypothetical protein
MASNINANNIDGAYPVAGQDNDSQGFRDNFTNTRTNFQFAREEITDLQDRAVLTSPLGGGAAPANFNNMGGSPLIDFQAQDVAYKFLNLGTVSGSRTINYTLGQYQEVTPSGTLTLGFTNFPDEGISGEVAVLINFPTQVFPVRFTSLQSWQNEEIQGVTVISATTLEFNAPATGRYLFTVYSDDGDNGVFRIAQSNQALQPFNNSVEVANIAASNVVSLSTTVSVFDTTTGNVATMAAGVAGQVKILAASNVAASNATITVINPGWGGTGNVNLNGNGQTATLMYANSKWYCIGTGPDATGNIALFT